MNIRLDDEKKQNKNLKLMYIIIISICIIAILATVIIQIVKNKPEKEGNDVDTSYLQKYKDDFDKIFTNKVNYLKNNEYKIDRIDESKQIIYTGYTNKENKVSDYNLDVNIPYINIKNSVIEKFNKDIRDTFEQKAKDVLSTQSQNIIYTVDYSAYITNNMLSLVVRSTLKEGENPQRDIVQTYNYDLTEKKEISFEDLLNFRGITRQEAGNKIKSEIKTVENKINELSQLGYKVYLRDSNSDIYKLDNITEYFIGEDNVIYIIFAYGNQNNTSEMDIVIM
jgi:hypothetical protein